MEFPPPPPNKEHTSLKSFENSLTVDMAIVAASSKGYLKEFDKE